MIKYCNIQKRTDIKANVSGGSGVFDDVLITYHFDTVADRLFSGEIENKAAPTPVETEQRVRL